MDALGESTAIHALALAIAKQLRAEEIARLGLLLIQLERRWTPSRRWGN